MIVFKPSTLLSLHRALTRRKHRQLFSSKVPTKPGPNGPSQDLIAAVVEMKQRNPSWGCPRIAQQIALAFGTSINKDVVQRILGARYQPKPDSAGPSWLTVLGHGQDSLWSLDLFRCESAVLRTHWVLVVMDQCTRRSHPFVERLVGTIRRECLDRTLFWTAADFEVKLLDFQRYFNGHRTHAGLGGLTPEPRTCEDGARASVRQYRWRLHCRGLYQTPIAA